MIHTHTHTHTHRSTTTVTIITIMIVNATALGLADPAARGIGAILGMSVITHRNLALSDIYISVFGQNAP